MYYGVSLAFTRRRWRSMLCVEYHAHRCCFRSGRLCLAKACCLACWQGNLPDYDILVKCVLREANCVSCARVMARGAVSCLASVKGSCERLYRAPTRLFLSKRRAHPCALAFVFFFQSSTPRPLRLGAFVVLLPLPLQENKNTTKERRHKEWEFDGVPWYFMSITARETLPDAFPERRASLRPHRSW
jgi:hypothetical protein